MSGFFEPPLSVVLATTHPWPAARECLAILAPQAADTGAEIVLGDSSGRALPEPLPPWLSTVRVVHAAGASIFELRSRATEAARGSIVAWTEDHCRPANDWCRRILAAHAEQAEAIAIGGAIHNGSTASVVDWANFLTTFAPFLPPLDVTRIGRVPAAANVSFKRTAIVPALPAPGATEFRALPHWWKMRRVRFDERIAVHHVQSWGLWGTAAAHFHNGRSTTGLPVRRLPLARRLARALLCVALPAEMIRTVVLPLVPKPAAWMPLLKSLPLIALLSGFHAAGELAGLVSGAGSSPHRLE